MYLIVGLGNPGGKYAGNRHNVGFHVIDEIGRRISADFKDKFQGLWARGDLAGQPCVLLKPQTFMNLSGESVQKAMDFFRVDLAHVLVVHDELGLAFQDVRLKIGGGLAGHNGLRSITKCCGGQDFARIRVGIGRPIHGAVDAFVLSDFSGAEKPFLQHVVDKAADIAETHLRG